MSVSVAYLLMQMPAPSEVFLAVEVNALIRAGVDVKVFCLRPRHAQHNKLLSDQELTDTPIYFFRWFALRDVFYWFRRSPGILSHMLALIFRTCWRRPAILIKSLAILPKSFSVARCIEQERPSIVHAAWGHYPAITAYLIKRLMPPIQFTLALGAYDRVMQHPMTVLAARHATCVLTQSEASADLLRNYWPKPPKPILVIPRGIDLQALNSVSETEERIPGLIVSAGRLIRVKGHQHVVRAYARVHKIMPQARLLIIGEGAYRPTLQQIVARLGLAGSVEFLGHLSQPELFHQISKSSLFVLASESEADNLPNSVKEAMSIGIPVITTPTTGIGELLQDGISGCIVPMGDVEAIADAMIRILSDEGLARSLARQAIAHVEERFDVRKTTELRKKLFEALAM
jgi:colanic acid/amylovoran biosynthesis glycosyltransferase